MTPHVAQFGTVAAQQLVLQESEVHSASAEHAAPGRLAVAHAPAMTSPTLHDVQPPLLLQDVHAAPTLAAQQ